MITGSKIWRIYTELPGKRQSPALHLSLEILKIPDNNLANENAVDVIINQLNRLYKEDSEVTKYQALEALKLSDDHVICQYNHSLMNLKRDRTKPSHMVLKCLEIS